MMSSANAGSMSAVVMLNAVSAAATVNATSGYVSLAGYEGDVIILEQLGAVTGSIVGKIQGADDGSGTNVADIAGAVFTSRSTANHTSVVVIPAGSAAYIRYVGTVVTGPALISVVLLGSQKYV